MLGSVLLVVGVEDAKNKAQKVQCQNANFNGFEASYVSVARHAGMCARAFLCRRARVCVYVRICAREFVCAREHLCEMRESVHMHTCVRLISQALRLSLAPHAHVLFCPSLRQALGFATVLMMGVSGFFLWREVRNSR